MSSTAGRDGTRDLLGAFDEVLDYYVSAPDDGDKGLALATGEFVMMLSADDVYTPGAVETLLRNHAASGADVVGALATLKGANDAMSYVYTRALPDRHVPALRKLARRLWAASRSPATPRSRPVSTPPACACMRLPSRCWKCGRVACPPTRPRSAPSIATQRFSTPAYDRAIAATQDHPAFVEALIADGYGRPGGYSQREPAPAPVATQIRR